MKIFFGGRSCAQAKHEQWTQMSQPCIGVFVHVCSVGRFSLLVFHTRVMLINELLRWRPFRCSYVHSHSWRNTLEQQQSFRDTILQLHSCVVHRVHEVEQGCVGCPYDFLFRYPASLGLRKHNSPLPPSIGAPCLLAASIVIVMEGSHLCSSHHTKV